MSNVFVANRDKKNRFSIFYTYDRVCDFLKTYGTITNETYEYMQAVLMGWFWDFFSRVIISTTDEKKLTDHVAKLVFNPKFDELMSYHGSGKYRNIADYTQRIAYCTLLRNTLIGQKLIKNRNGLWKKDLKLSVFTANKIDRIIQKLDETMENLNRLQEEQNA